MPATAKMTGGVSIEKHVLPMSPPCSITALARIALSLKEAGKSRDAAEVTKAVEEIARLRTLRSLAWNLKDKPSGVERDRDALQAKVKDYSTYMVALQNRVTELENYIMENVDPMDTKDAAFFFEIHRRVRPENYK